MTRGPQSIQGRLFVLAALLTAFTLLVAGLALADVLERFATRSIDRRIDAQISLLASAVGADGRIDTTRLVARRGGLEDGPGWIWRINGPHGSYCSSQLPIIPRGDQPPPPPPARPYVSNGTASNDVAYHSHQLRIATSDGPVTVIAAVRRSDFVRPIGEAILPLLALLGLLGALLATASVVQLRIGLRPLRRFQDAVAAIRSGERHRIEEQQLAELRPLAAELNALAADSERTLGAARLSAANLAHALKTPVAILKISTEGMPMLAAEVDRIETTIRHHLARARMTTIDKRAYGELSPIIAGLALATRGLNAERAITIEIDVEPDLSVQADGNDVAEMIGNLMDNAARHARASVTVSARRDGRVVRIAIADDGEGMADEQQRRISTPPIRLDKRGSPRGLGLSITRELAELYGGRLELDNAPNGGLCASIVLPLHLEGAAST